MELSTFESEEITGIVDSTAQRLKYERSRSKILHSVKWGHRKLILNELRFITLFWDRVNVPKLQVVYIGAAPGDHIPILSSLFPDITFNLYDPSPFIIGATDSIKIYNRFFTDNDAEYWSGRDNVFLISDIRTANYDKAKRLGEEGKFKVEADVWKDHLRQMNWLKKINPIQAQLKLRLPYPDQWKEGWEKKTKLFSKLPTYPNPEIVEYLDGYIFIQPWCSSTSTESRLVPKRNEKGEFYSVGWNITEYEEIFSYHNNVEREKNWLNPFTQEKEPIRTPELLNDYDSTLEAIIIREYLVKFSGVNDLEDVAGYSDFITENLGEIRKPKSLNGLRNSKYRGHIVK